MAAIFFTISENTYFPKGEGLSRSNWKPFGVVLNL